MKRILVFIFLTFIILNGTAQRGRGNYGKGKKQTIKGYISGNIIDSISGEPVEFAVVELLSALKNKQVNGDISNEEGHFKLTDVKTGKYNLKVSFLGYSPKIIENVQLTLSKPDKIIKNILLSPNDFMLDAVQIMDQRSLIETKIDKMVYNVSKDPTLTGGDATDVLRKVPMLTVDMDGNVSLRGSEKVKILLNGKPSGLFSDDVGEALQMFPADEIKKVEVLTSPGAKYDGEGSAGIVNIITKKGIIKGIKGSVRSFFGDKMEHLGGSIAIGRGRFGANARLGFRYKLPRNSSANFFKETFSGENKGIVTNKGITETSRLGFGSLIGAFYDFNAYNSINTSLRFRGHNYYNDGGTDILKVDGDNNILQNYSRTENSERLRNLYNWSTDYTKKFKSNKEKKLIFAIQIEGTQHTNTNSKQNSILPNKENNDNKGINREITLQTDFVQPITKSVKLEIGAKSILRNLNSDFSRSYTDPNGIVYTDPQYSDIFHYNQNVYAGYASTTINLPSKFGIIAGVRYEQTDIQGEFDESDRDFKNNYNNWIPSITVSKRFNDFSSLKLSYNERIHRPSLRNINPFIDNINPESISYGNPDLSPELTRQFEMGYSKFLKGSMVNLSLYYKTTRDVINSFLTIGHDGISRTTYYNIGSAQTYGFNIFSSLKLFKILEMRGNFNLNKHVITGENQRQGLTNESYRYNAFLSSTLSLTKGWKAEVWGFFNSPKSTLQGKLPSFSIFSLGIQKEILNKNGKIGLRLVEPFRADKVFLSEFEGTNFYQKSEISIPFRSIGLTFSYSFGKLDFKSRKSVIRNDDLKQSEGGEDMEQGEK